MDRWRLPGPRSFFLRAIDSLREGYSLVLATPARGVGELPEILRCNLLDDGWSVAALVNDDGKNPLDLLYAALDITDAGAARRSVSVLIAHIDPGQVVIVQRIGNERWSEWRQFMADFEAASRNISRFERPLVVAVTEGVPVANMGRPAAALKHLVWQDIVGELDILLFTRETMRLQPSRAGKEKLLSRVIARLALWDFDLAEKLTTCDEKLLFEPVKALRWAASELGDESQWQATWDSGGKILFDGVDMDHPFFILAYESKHDLLRRRLWEAQAGELFPLIELQRHALAHRIRSMIRFPYRMDDQVFNDVDELEIGQLSYLARVSKLPQSIRHSTEKLRRYRNKLAHMEALDYLETFDPELR